MDHERTFFSEIVFTIITNTNNAYVTYYTNPISIYIYQYSSLRILMKGFFS